MVNKWSSLKGAFSSGVSETTIQEISQFLTAAFDSSHASQSYYDARYLWMRCLISIDGIRGTVYSHSTSFSASVFKDLSF